MSLKIDGYNPIYQLYNITDTNATNTTNNTFWNTGTTKSADEDTQNNGNPALEKPDAKFNPFAQLTTYTAPSMGASVLSLITEINAEQRQAARQQKALQTEAQVANIMEQADVMREKAITQLCIGVATGLLSVAQGVYSMGMAAQGADSTQIQAFNSVMGGLVNTISSINQTVGGFYDAEVKELEAKQERMKAMQDSLDSLEQSLKETIQKALSTQDAIQENINQTRTKILG